MNPEEEPKKAEMLTSLVDFPARYADLPRPTDGPWFEATKKVCARLSNGSIVITFGDRGTGKSFMSYVLARGSQYFEDTHYPADFQSTIRLRRPAIYRTAMRIFMELKATYGTKRSELEVMDELAGAVLLVIDEIQERGETPWENQKLAAIVDSRYQAKRPTLLIGNYLTIEELENSLSPSIASRIQEGGGAIHCNWPSFRGKP